MYICANDIFWMVKEDMNRPSKHDYYLDIAETVSERSTCLKKHYGAVIVKDDEIVATGYNGSVRGLPNCCDTGVCKRENIERGVGYDIVTCAVHAEANAIISAPRSRMIGATLYLSGFDITTGERVDNPAPCNQCIRLIANAGIAEVYVREKNLSVTRIDIAEWIANASDLYRTTT